MDNDIVQVDKQFIALVAAENYEATEQLLLGKYKEFRSVGEETALRHILNQLANFYCLPFKKTWLRQSSITLSY